MKKLILGALLLLSINSFSQSLDLSFGLIKKSGDTLTVDIWVDNQVDNIRNFNFELRGIGGDVTLLDHTGEGTAYSSGFSLTVADASKKINGLNFGGGDVPIGSSMLIGIRFLNPLGVTNVCIENPSFGNATVTTGACADLSTAIIGIEDPEASTGLEIYPNPMKNTAVIKTAINTFQNQVNIYTATGALVRSYKNENFNQGSITVERGNLATGIYIVQLTGSAGPSSSKLIIQ